MSPALSRRLRLARQILASHYNQPATALWRVFEVEIVQDRLRGPGRALDLGCGDGSLARILFDRLTDVRWTGIDIDPGDAASARDSGVYERVHVASASAVPEPDGAFDLVFANSSIEHMDDLDAVLAEVRRVLRVGGRFVATVPSGAFHDALLWPRVLRSAVGPKLAESYLGHIDRRLRHVNLLTEEAWRERLASHGLAVTVARPYLSARVVDAWETLSNATGGVAYALAGGHKTPREIQDSVGLLRMERPWLGDLALGAMLPVLLATATERQPSRFGCLYLEAAREP